MPNIPGRLRELMHLCNMSQARLSEESQISKTEISNILTGKCNPKVDTLELICEALNVDLIELLSSDNLQEKKRYINSDYFINEMKDSDFLDEDRKKAIEFVINASPVILSSFLKIAEALCKTEMESGLDNKSDI